MRPEHFDAVVIGSGFGGAVTAYRLAAAGMTVCLLERGKQYRPGDFARTPAEWSRNFWDPSEGLHGLFDLWSFKGLEAIVASGLGGGSLIYANVLLRKPEKWFVREDLQHGGYESWPIKYRELDEHYTAVERMLGAEPYPLGRDPWDELPKAQAFADAVAALGARAELPRLAVTFGGKGDEPGVPIPGWNAAARGYHRYTCRRCGECDVGCNYGSKNTLDHTYLAALDRRFGTVRPHAEVRSFRPLGSRGFEVRYVDHSRATGEPTDTSRLPERVVTAEQLVLAAGTLGTTYLLLKNREQFPGIGAPLGSRFCGNGDLLGFARNCRRDGKPRPIDPTRGPVITSMLHMQDALDGDIGRGFFLQDGGYPQFVNWLIEAASVGAVTRRAIQLAWHWLKLRVGLTTDTNLSAELAAMIGPAHLSSTSLTLLGIGRDIPDGRMALADSLLQVDWSTESSREYFERVRRTMAELAAKLEADFVPNPLSHLQRVVTVHPLGGCPMGQNGSQGVVDGHGQVFNHPGLWVTDGSVMPGPVGSNPSLTIAAFADRTAEEIIAQHQRWQGGVLRRAEGG